MDGIEPPHLHDYAHATALEWVQSDGVGGVSSSSILGVNTRKQHGVFSVALEPEGRLILVANLQETLVCNGRSYDLSSNAYFGAVYPRGYERLERFSMDPWPQWLFRLDDVQLLKELIIVRGEHTAIVTYTLVSSAHPATLDVRPLLAFRDYNKIRTESATFVENWQVTDEFVECTPFGDAPALFIAHPNARVETVGMWYRGFLYERDRESHLQCIEDLYHPGYFEIELRPGIPRSLVFASPSPRSVDMADSYMTAERRRRRAVAEVAEGVKDAFLLRLLHAVDEFPYERFDGSPGILSGLSWGEQETFRGLIAFPGVLLVPKRFDMARAFLEGVARQWREAGSPARFAPECARGQMHPLDVPLWVFVAAWRYWRAVGRDAFMRDTFVNVMKEIASCYEESVEIRNTGDRLLEVGHEPGANYEPLLPLGTNVLWYNAQMMLAEILDADDKALAARWRQGGEETFRNLRALFACESRAGLADSVYGQPVLRREGLHVSQVLALGLPFCAVPDPEATARLVRDRLGTPYGPRTLSPIEPGYVGDGTDVCVLPKEWLGSVDPMWFGYYIDGLKRGGLRPSFDTLFLPFAEELDRRGLGHISGAFCGDPPHRPCDYVASAGAAGEVLRIYARERLHLAHVT